MIASAAMWFRNRGILTSGEPVLGLGCRVLQCWMQVRHLWSESLQASSPTVQSTAQLPPSHGNATLPEADTATLPDASYIVPPQTLTSPNVQSSVAVSPSLDSRRSPTSSSSVTGSTGGSASSSETTPWSLWRMGYLSTCWSNNLPCVIPVVYINIVHSLFILQLNLGQFGIAETFSSQHMYFVYWYLAECCFMDFGF